MTINSKPDAKNNKKSKLLRLINYLNLLCDTFLTVLINIFTKFSVSAIILGVSLVLVRVFVKLICIKFNYRKPRSLNNSLLGEMPKKSIKHLLILILTCFCLISAATYFINKNFSFRALLGDKLNSSIFFQIILYIISIWAILTFIISVLPAFFYKIIKMREAEQCFVFKEQVFHKSELDLPNNDNEKLSSYVRVIPELKVNIANFTKQNVDALYLKKSNKSESYSNLPENFTLQDSGLVTYKLEDKLYVVQKIILNKQESAELHLYNYTPQAKKITSEESKITQMSWIWNILAFMTSNTIKIPSSIIDFLTDLPFTYLTIVYSGYNSLIIYFLMACIPMMLCECLVYNLNYFFQRTESPNKITQGQPKNKSNKKILYYICMTASYISAFSKIFTKTYTLYNICFVITHNSLVASLFSFISAFVYSIRNFANVLNAERTIFSLTHTNPLASKELDAKNPTNHETLAATNCPNHETLYKKPNTN